MREETIVKVPHRMLSTGIAQLSTLFCPLQSCTRVSMTFIAHSLGCSFKKNVCRVSVVLDTTNGAARMLASWSLLLCGIYCGHSKQSLFLNVKSALQWPLLFLSFLHHLSPLSPSLPQVLKALGHSYIPAASTVPCVRCVWMECPTPVTCWRHQCKH